MNRIITSFKINTRNIVLPVQAEQIAPGDDTVQFLQDDSPARHTDWENNGYTVTKFLKDKDNIIIKTQITEIIKTYLKGLNIETVDFSLENYHNHVTTEQHLLLMDQIRAGSHGTGGILFERLGISTDNLDAEISRICNTQTTCRKFFDLGNGKTYRVGHFFVRIIRPGTNSDNNPPHKDTHIARLRNAVNLYYPIAGSDSNSSLPIIPGSHLWSEQSIIKTSGETLINGMKYNVPAIIATSNGLNLITPNPHCGSAMIFTPYAIHGGGINFNANTTRVSLEIRFWKN